MEGAEPLVERDRAVGVVALEVLVVEVVRVAVGVDRALLADHDLLEAGMARHRRQAGMDQVEQRVHRVRGQHPVDQHAREVEQVLDRVHRQARPGAGVGVLVVQLVGDPVERRDVQQPVHQVEVDLAQQGDGEHQQREPDRMRVPGEPGHEAVGEDPERQDLVGGPDRHAAGQRPDHVVGGLAAEQEGPVVGRRPLGVVLELLPLCLADVEAQVERAEEQHGQREVAREHQRDPAGRQRPQGLDRGREVEPDADRDAGRRAGSRAAGSSGSRAASARSRPADRPDEHRRILDRLEGMPVAPAVALAIAGIVHGAVLPAPRRRDAAPRSRRSSRRRA